MKLIKDIKSQFQTEEAYSIYADCMYMPDYDKFMIRSSELVQNSNVSIYGLYEDQKLLGVLAIRGVHNGYFIIEGISVDTVVRRMGVGRQLIEYVMEEKSITILEAETDDDSVLFYQKCGFQTKEFWKGYETKKIKRYKCLLQRK